MLKTLGLLAVGVATGHVLERRLITFGSTWKARALIVEQERQVGKAMAAVAALQDGYDIWITTPEAQEMIKRAMGVQDKAAEQAATS